MRHEQIELNGIQIDKGLEDLMATLWCRARRNDTLSQLVERYSTHPDIDKVAELLGKFSVLSSGVVAHAQVSFFSVRSMSLNRV